MKLSEATEGQTYTLTSAGNDPHFTRRAGSMGLVPDTEIRIIRNQAKMPVLLFARDTLIAVNQKDAAGIEVEPNV
ncbi:MAG: ferrous iron transport protein A [Oscillospiraceae bacterium]|nr:ferrous iron transport protein A [Oscillospiraceae bacterium]